MIGNPNRKIGICSSGPQGEQNFYINARREMLTDFLALMIELKRKGVSFSHVPQVFGYIGDWNDYLDIRTRNRLLELEKSLSQINLIKNFQGKNLILPSILALPQEGMQIIRNYTKFILNHAVPAVFIEDLSVNAANVIASGASADILDILGWKSPYWNLDSQTLIMNAAQERKPTSRQILKNLKTASNNREHSTKELEIGLELFGTPNVDVFFAAILNTDKEEDDYDQEGDSIMEGNQSCPQGSRFHYENTSTNNPLIGFLGNKAEFGTLESFLGNSETFDSDDWNGLVDQLNGLAKAIATIHDSFQITHRDIKMNNILVCQAQDSEDCYQFKLADFGLAEKWGRVMHWQVAHGREKEFYPMENYDPSLSKFLNGPDADIFQFGLVLKSIAVMLYKSYGQSWAFNLFGPIITSMTQKNPQRKRLNQDSMLKYFQMLEDLNLAEDSSSCIINVTLEIPQSSNEITLWDDYRGIHEVHDKSKEMNFIFVAPLHNPFEKKIIFSHNGGNFLGEFKAYSSAISPSMTLYFPKGLPFQISGSFSIMESIKIGKGDWIFLNTVFQGHSICIESLQPNGPNECYTNLNALDVLNKIRKRLQQGNWGKTYPIEMIF